MLKRMFNKIKSLFSFDNMLLLLAFLVGINFFEHGNIFFVAFIALSIIKMFVCNEIKIHKEIVIIALFAISFFIIYSIHDSFSIANICYYLLFPICCFIIGSSITENNPESTKKVVKTLSSFALGFFIVVFLNFIKTIVVLGVNVNTRSLLSIWRKENFFVTATGINLHIVLFMMYALVFLVFKFKGRKWYHIVLAVLGILFCIYITFHSKNRAFFVIMLLTAIGLPICLTIVNKDKRKFYLILTIVITLIIAILTAIAVFVPSVNAWLRQNPLFNRLLNPDESSFASRKRYYEIFFKIFHKYPFGNMLSDNYFAGGDEIEYIHNLWLDIYKNAGAIPFVFFVVMSANMIYQVFYLSTRLENKKYAVFLLLSVYGIFILGLLEPIMDGNIYFTSLIYIIAGVLSRLSFIVKREKKNNVSYSNIDKNNFKIVMVTNFMSIHQISFHNEMVKRYGNRYHFIALENYSDNHQIYIAGYNQKISNVVKFYKKPSQASKLIEEADIVLYGNASDKILKLARKKGKILIKCSERLFKNYRYQRWSLKSILSYFKHLFPYEKKYSPICFTLSGYAAYDLNSINCSYNNCYSWGYWTIDNQYSSFEELEKIKDYDTINICFVNKLIDWKHPNKIIGLASYLRDKNIKFHIDIVGEGELKDSLISDIELHNLSSFITIHDLMPNNKVRALMERSSIVLNLSDRNEGWGVSVNEGMLSGCAVVVSHEVGAAPVLIKNGTNGFVYSFNNDQDLYVKVATLCVDKELLKSMQKSAFETIKECYNVENICERFDTFIKNKIDGKNFAYENGPLSKSPIFNEFDYRDTVNQKYGAATSNVKAYLESTNKDDDHNGDNNNNKMKKGALLSYLAIFFTIIAGLFYTPWMINELGQSNYGIYSLAISLTSILTVDLGLGTAVSRFVAKYKSESDSNKANNVISFIYKIFMIMSVIIVAILIAIYFNLGTIYKELTKEELEAFKSVYFAIGLYSVIVFAFTPLNGIIIGNDLYPQLKIINLISKVLNVVFVVVILLIKSDLYLFVLAVVITGLIDLLIKYLFVKKKCKYGNKFIFKQNKDSVLLSQLLRFTSWAAVATIVSRFVVSIQPTILGITAGAIQIAVFSLGSSIEGYTWLIADALNGMLVPKVSEMNKRNASGEEYTSLMISMGRIQLLLTGLVLVAFIALGRDFINVIWKVGDNNNYDDSYFVALFMFIPLFFTISQESGITTLVVKGKVKYHGIAMIITALSSMGLSFLLTFLFPNRAAFMAGLAVGVGRFIGLVLYLNYIYKSKININIQRFFKECHLKVMPPLLIVMIIGLLLDKFYPTTGLVPFLIKGIIIVIIYLLLICKFTMNKHEKSIISYFIDKIFIFFYRFNGKANLSLNIPVAQEKADFIKGGD